jgi:phosphate transport system substrate-binding protein
MIEPSHRRTRLVGVSLIVTLGLVLVACGSSKKSSSTATTAGGGGGGTTATTSAKLAAATLNGSGSTLQAAFIQDAITSFTQANPGVNVTYAGGGSGKGQTDLAGKLVNYAGSDAPITQANLPKFGGADAILYFPDVASPISMAYNLSGVSKLNLDGPVIAQIYSGKITTWNDPAIAALNSGVSLPSTKITAVHRSDASGTTNNFTLFLTKAAPSDWTLGSGTTINWPGGLTGNGNPGVAQAIKQTPGGIGYVDFSDAKASGLSLASIKNKDGSFVAPSLAGATAAIQTATINPDLTYDPLFASGPNAYPITSPTWIIIYKMQTATNTGQALKAFIAYLLGPAQTQIATQDNFAPLPPNLVTMARNQLNSIVIP